MIKFTLKKHIAYTAPQEVFETLSEPEGLKALLPRMRKIEFKNRTAHKADVVMHIAIGQMFGVIRCEGQLAWVEPESLTFKVQSPLPVETVWKLTPARNGTDVHITMSLDLVPLLGPMAAFVPTDIVIEMMTNEIKHAMREVEARIQRTRAQNRPAAA
ncbi:MAG: SRPBCC family protein [Chloroflexaceae bacterium]|nr:SRPBCC family protein [Chloroflexaceae bacterium]NJO05348.1 SRPBCC family protein [Chloroflexaceae bacterium]